MIAAFLGTKLEQSQTFTAEGKRIPVTTIQAGPCWVTAVKDMGEFRRVQLGFGIAKHVTKPQQGHLKQVGLDRKLRFLREFRVSDRSLEIKPGDEITVDKVFQVGDRVWVTGTSKGKGFAGAVKRYHFEGGPRTHGQSDRERAPGSIGQSTTPGRVYRGKRMAGRMGGEAVTAKGLTVVGIDSDKGTLTVKGLVPGAKSGLLVIKKK